MAEKKAIECTDGIGVQLAGGREVSLFRANVQGDEQIFHVIMFTRPKRDNEEAVPGYTEIDGDKVHTRVGVSEEALYALGALIDMKRDVLLIPENPGGAA